jgi:biopolymer transport protein ExbD
MAVGGGGGPKSDINVTPYIDILLVLLIIFMVITPFTPHGIDVRVPEKLPPEVTQEIADRFQGIVISLNTDGSMFINKDPVNFDTLSQRLTQIYSARADKSIFIKGAKGLVYGDIVKAIDIAKGAGVEQIGLMTELE